jgi:16S rRNA (uracil1498-N3)-methyltransferase
MALPFFFVDDLNISAIVLAEDSSKHITQVLRKKIGDQILLTDGKGTKAITEITNDHRKHCEVKIISVEKENEPQQKITIAISLIKNTSRFEWFLEKATEIGVNEIIPLVCERTEREKFRYERLNGILVSAMLQSQQCWLPLLHQPTEFKNIITKQSDKKFIAHCLDEEKKSLSNELLNSSTTKQLNGSSQLILIGPEGDFTEKEIMLATQNNFQPVTLGHNRLRTETAALVAAVLLCNHQNSGK